MLTDVTPDHVAMAVPAIDAALPRWEDDLGGGTSGWFSNGIFRSRQIRYANGVKVELLAPHERDTSEDNFVRRFLDSRGAIVHHVTLLVPEIHRGVAQAEDAGFDVVDLDDSHELWKEAFLRPSQVGGIIVQIAENNETDAEWAARSSCEIVTPSPDGADIRGPVLAQTDLDAATDVWQCLGADVTSDTGDLEVSWPTGPLRIRLTRGERSAPLGIRAANTTPRPQDPTLGAAILPTPTR